MCRSLLVSLLVCAAGSGSGAGRDEYLPTWDSLDSRPLPPWYDQAKIGIFIHWGVYSVPSFGTEWFWNNWKGKRIRRYEEFMRENYPPGFTYRDFGPQFKAEFYEPEEWAELFKASGARYVVLTSKHHEGFTLWPSNYSWGWNSVDVGPKRDLLGDLARAIRSKAPELHFGVYYSLYEWFNPIFLMDKANKLRTKHFVSQKVIPELLDLVNTYRPEVVWSDGEWEAPYHYWNSTEFLAWLFNSSPVKDTVVVNDRWGSGPILCRHGSFYTCADRFNPGVLQPHKWENAMTLDRWSWGYRRRAKVRHYLSIHALLTRLAMTISCGGNLLVNVGPTKDGLIPPIMEERLRQMGTWLDINGKAIYESQPWKYQNDSLTSGVWFTSREGAVYAIVLHWPEGGTLALGSVLPTATTTVTMLGHGRPLQFQVKEKVLQVTFPYMSVVRSQWVWVLELDDVTPRQPPTNTTTTTNQ